MGVLLGFGLFGAFLVLFVCLGGLGFFLNTRLRSFRSACSFHDHVNQTNKTRFETRELESRREGLALDRYSTSALLMTFLFLTGFSLMSLHLKSVLIFFPHLHHQKKDLSSFFQPAESVIKNH